MLPGNFITARGMAPGFWVIVIIVISSNIINRISKSAPSNERRWG